MSAVSGPLPGAGRSRTASFPCLAVGMLLVEGSQQVQTGASKSYDLLLPRWQPRLKGKPIAEAFFKPLLVAPIFYYPLTKTWPGPQSIWKDTKGVDTGKTKHMQTITATISHSE